MSFLKVEISRRSCVFVLQIHTPTDTLRRLALFFLDMQMVINDFNLHRYQDGTAMVIVHCMIGKDVVDETTAMLHQLPGIIKVDLMEGK